MEVDAEGIRAEGTQIGVAYELRYRLAYPSEFEVVGGPSARVEPGDADFVDLGFSPLTNTLPILRDDLAGGEGRARDYVMALVDVLSLEVSRSSQRYEPLGRGRVQFSSGDFSALLELDETGFVLRYPGLAERVPL